MAKDDPKNQDEAPANAPFEITSRSVREALSRVKGDEPRPAEPAAAPRVAPAPSASGTMRDSLAIPEPAAAPTSPPSFNFSFGGPSNLDRAVFCRQFATLVEVGIPVMKALKMLAERTPHRRLREAVAETAKGVEEGQPIHVSMARNLNVFTPIVVSIVKVGEVGGMLEESLVRLAEIMESKAKIRRQVASASMYPVVAIGVAVIAVILIMTGPIPAFKSVYATTGHELPRITRVMIHMSDILVATWPLLIILAVAGIIWLKIWNRTPSGNRFFSTLYLRIPIMSAINRKIAAARFSRTLGGLLRAGIPLTEALRITADSSENMLVADALRGVHESVGRGERMAQPLMDAKVFPEILVDMVSIGEDTGTLDQMLGRVAVIYEGEVDSTLAGLTSIIEPLLIVLLGGVVIFIALALLLPYFNMVHVVGE